VAAAVVGQVPPWRRRMGTPTAKTEARRRKEQPRRLVCDWSAWRHLFATPATARDDSMERIHPRRTGETGSGDEGKEGWGTIATRARAAANVTDGSTVATAQPQQNEALRIPLQLAPAGCGATRTSGDENGECWNGRQQLLLVVAPSHTRINGARAGTSMFWRQRSTFVLDKYNYMNYLHAISPADEEVILMR